jgi:RHS repeat-associated protein
MRGITKLFSFVILSVLIWAGFAFAGQKVFYYHTDPAGTPLVMTDEKRNVVWRAEYKPFGEEYLITESIWNDHKFVGKEQDQETGLYYFGARYMEPLIGRFISTDPVGAVDSKNGKINEKNILDPQRLNYYAYALNNSYKWVDFLGLAPGDPYPTRDAAAIDAIKDINRTSIREGVEYGGRIYQNPSGTYSYTPPIKGTKDSVDVGPVPSGKKDAGDYHTHGDNDPHYVNEDFSPPDKRGNDATGQPGYLGTPTEVIKKYTPKRGVPYGGETTILRK